MVAKLSTPRARETEPRAGATEAVEEVEVEKKLRAEEAEKKLRATLRARAIEEREAGQLRARKEGVAMCAEKQELKRLSPLARQVRAREIEEREAASRASSSNEGVEVTPSTLGGRWYRYIIGDTAKDESDRVEPTLVHPPGSRVSHEAKDHYPDGFRVEGIELAIRKAGYKTGLGGWQLPPTIEEERKMKEEEEAEKNPDRTTIRVGRRLVRSPQTTDDERGVQEGEPGEPTFCEFASITINMSLGNCCRGMSRMFATFVPSYQDFLTYFRFTVLAIAALTAGAFICMGIAYYVGYTGIGFAETF